MPRRVRKAPYSRTGCVTCKQRHKKCDDKRPRCDTCTRLGLVCIQPDGFRNFKSSSSSAAPSSALPDFTNGCFTFSAAPYNHLTSTDLSEAGGSACSFPSDRELKHAFLDAHPSETDSPGSSLSSPSPSSSLSSTSDRPFSQSMSYSSPQSFTLLSPRQMDTSLPSSTQQSRSASPDQTIDLSLPIHVGYFSNMSSIDWQLLQYYVEKLSDLILNGHAPQNPLRSVVLPRMASSPLLLQAVCSIAAQHRANSATEDKQQLQRMATGYYVRALSNLKEWIPYISWMQDTSTCMDSEAIELVLLISVFLCKHEIIKAGVANWRPHLLGVESFCQALEGSRGDSMTDTVKYARSFIMYHRSISSITEQVVLGSQARSQKPKISQEQPSDLDYVVDPYMGLSKCLVLVLERVSALTRFKTDTVAQRQSLKVEIMEILDLVNDRSWTLKMAFLPSDMSSQSIGRLIHIARAYEATVYAYLHSTIDELAREDSFCHDDGLWPELYRLIPIGRSKATANCYQEISSVPVGCPEEPGLLPLLFIISCISENAEQTWVAFKRVESLAANFCLGNMNFIREFVFEIWSRRVKSSDWSDWRKLLADFKWDLILC